MKSLDKKIIQEETFNDNNTELWCKKLKERKLQLGKLLAGLSIRRMKKFLLSLKMCFWRNLLDLPYMGNVLVDEGNREDFVKVLQIICNNFVLVIQFAKNRSRAI